MDCKDFEDELQKYQENSIDIEGRVIRRVKRDNMQERYFIQLEYEGVTVMSRHISLTIRRLSPHIGLMNCTKGQRHHQQLQRRSTKLSYLRHVSAIDLIPCDIHLLPCTIPWLFVLFHITLTLSYHDLLEYNLYLPDS